jgi:hypothetical protein
LYIILVIKNIAAVFGFIKSILKRVVIFLATLKIKTNSQGVLIMKFIIDKNCTGKTRRLIKQSLDTEVPIFALHAGKAMSLREKSISYFDKLVHVVTPQDFSDGYTGQILVDDMETVFKNLLAAYVKSEDFDIVTATMTEE